MEMQTAIVTGLFSIVASILTIILKEYYDNRRGSYEKVESRISDIVSGRWKGSFEQMYDKQITKFDVFLELKVNSQGHISGKSKIPGHDGTSLEFALKGGFHSQRFLQMDYENIEKAVLQFGSFILKLSDNAEKLEGDFVGYSKYAGKIVSGTANFIKS